jgi:hypothetical protein
MKTKFSPKWNTEIQFTVERISFIVHQKRQLESEILELP